MASEPNGVPCRIPPGELLNVFALVVYIPDPLGKFLDDLRRELVPHYNPHAHVSVLPPRPLAVSWQTASHDAEVLTGKWSPFNVELTQVSIFPFTGVIYLEVGAGAEDLRRMHGAMNGTSLGFQEPFPYHPHITLAQELPQAQVTTVHTLASERWAHYRGERFFRAERAVFVQNTLSNCWIDLARYSLGSTLASPDPAPSPGPKTTR